MTNDERRHYGGYAARRQKKDREMTRSKGRVRWPLGACIAVLAATWLAPVQPVRAADDPVAEFFRGRRLVMISGHTPEGGDRQQERAFAGMTITSGLKARGEDDLHGRLLARHLGRHIPGAPDFVLQVMPGAGGRRAANYLYVEAPRDGTVIGNLERGLALEPLLSHASTDDEPQGPNISQHSRFDPRRFRWLGSLSDDVGFVVAWHTAPHRTAADLLSRPLVVGGTSARDDSVRLPRALNALLGTRFALIAGYGSAVELQIALERGEIAGFVTGHDDIKSRLIPWTQTGQARALLQLGVRRDADFEAASALDLAPDAAARAALALILARQEFGSPYVAPPDIPEARYRALRQAFDRTLEDAAFRADARRLDITLRPHSGDALAAIVARVVAAPRDSRERAAQAMARPLRGERDTKR